MNPPPQIATPTYLLVMTATIAPASAQVKRSSPRVRLEDYKRALRFWLSYPHPAAARILFLENSGADLSDLCAIAETENPFNREVEFLSLSRLKRFRPEPTTATQKCNRSTRGWPLANCTAKPRT